MRWITHALHTLDTFTGAAVHLVGDVLAHRHAQHH